MSLIEHHRDLEHCLRLAGVVLGERACAVALSDAVQELLKPHLRLQSRFGMGADKPMLSYTGGPKGVRLEQGLELLRLTARPAIGFQFNGQNHERLHVPVILNEK